MATESLATNIKFVLFCERSEQNSEKIRHLQSEIEDLELLGDVSLVFFDYQNVEELAQLDILIGVDFDEPFNDIEISALLANVPVIVPRTASRQNLLARYRWMGESYMRGDAREIKDKVLKILSNESVYLSEIQGFLDEFRAIHGGEIYTEKLGSHYERLCMGRRRLFDRKRK